MRGRGKFSIQKKSHNFCQTNFFLYLLPFTHNFSSKMYWNYIYYSTSQALISYLYKNVFFRLNRIEWNKIIVKSKRCKKIHVKIVHKMMTALKMYIMYCCNWNAILLTINLYRSVEFIVHQVFWDRAHGSNRKFHNMNKWI